MLRGAEKLVPAEYWCPYGTTHKIKNISQETSDQYFVIKQCSASSQWSVHENWFSFYYQKKNQSICTRLNQERDLLFITAYSPWTAMICS